jgi:hypothetical protein
MTNSGFIQGAVGSVELLGMAPVPILPTDSVPAPICDVTLLAPISQPALLPQ